MILYFFLSILIIYLSLSSTYSSIYIVYLSSIYLSIYHLSICLAMIYLSVYLYIIYLSINLIIYLSSLSHLNLSYILFYFLYRSYGRFILVFILLAPSFLHTLIVPTYTDIYYIYIMYCTI